MQTFVKRIAIGGGGGGGDMCNRLLLIKLSVLYAERLMHVTISIFSSQCVQTCYCKVNSIYVTI